MTRPGPPPDEITASNDHHEQDEQVEPQEQRRDVGELVGHAGAEESRTPMVTKLTAP